MKKRGKKYREVRKKVDRTTTYGLDEAVNLIKETAYVNFDATCEIHLNMNLDISKSDQQMRSTVVLPHGTGRDIKILVIAKGEKLDEAEKAGADFVGGEDMIEKVSGGWNEFNLVIATPDMMGKVGKLGRILGPQNMMPSPKTGTITFDIADTVKEFKQGKLEFRIKQSPIIHSYFGKVSMTEEQLKENLISLLKAIYKARPTGAKGRLVKKTVINATMGPGIILDMGEVEEHGRG